MSKSFVHYFGPVASPSIFATQIANDLRKLLGNEGTDVVSMFSMSITHSRDLQHWPHKLSVEVRILILWLRSPSYFAYL